MKKTISNDTVCPPRLRRGEVIGLVSPAGPVVVENDFIAGIKLLKDMGFRVRFASEPPPASEPYLAGPDMHRAAEFTAMWNDDEVAAVLAVRGGYGALRMLDFLRMDDIIKRPKPFIGFSDITTLITAIHKNTGLVVFHGPMLTTLAKSNAQSIDSFFAMLTNPEPSPVKAQGLEILRGGQATGKLVGGNLTSLIHLLATPYEIDWQGAILFLEDVNEPAYRVDRMLTHLDKAGRLKGVAGIILGEFKDCESTDLIWNRVLDLTSASRIPVWAAFPAGHGAANQILPIGLQVMQDSNSGLLQLLNSCVR